MHIHYNFATRNRPKKMADAIRSIKIFSKNSNYTIGLVIDDDDKITLDSAELATALIDYRVYVCPGMSKNKIAAINRGMLDWKGDIVINMSDDMRFKSHGFDNDIITGFDGNLDLFLHFPDGHVNHLLPTLSIMGRTYYERDGYIYHPQYENLWCDNEAMDVAKIRGCHKFINKHIFEHVHPLYTGEIPDALLIKTQSTYRADEITYIRRSRAAYPKHNV